MWQNLSFQDTFLSQTNVFLAIKVIIFAARYFYILFLLLGLKAKLSLGYK